MDNQVLNWICIIALALMPAVFCHGLVTATRGPVRILALLVVFALPVAGILQDHLCKSGGAVAFDNPCFAEDLMAWLSWVLGASAFIGAALGIARRPAHRTDSTSGSKNTEAVTFRS